MYRINYLIILSFVLFFSCDEMDYETINYESKVVVDGWIEPSAPCRVFLTKSVPYFSEIDSISLREYALTNAKVTLSNGDTSEILTLRPNYNYFPPYYYTSSIIYGEVGKTYSLKVESYGRVITAQTTIPKPAEMDSVWFELEEGKDSAGFIHIMFTDNPNIKNYYRISSMIKGKDSRFIPVLTPNFNDEYFNGQLVNVSIAKGSSSIVTEGDIYYHLGDTIMLKIATIDKDAFNFWNSFEKELINTGNPFASSNARVETNINGGLGIWCGYGTSFYVIIAE